MLTIENGIVFLTIETNDSDRPSDMLFLLKDVKMIRSHKLLSEDQSIYFVEITIGTSEIIDFDINVNELDQFRNEWINRNQDKL